MILPTLAEVFLISVLPISLIKFGIIPPKFRLVLLSAVCLLLFGLIYVEHIPLQNLGIRTDNFYSGFLSYLGATITGILFLIFLARKMKKVSAERWYTDPHFLFLFIPISFAQQFLFQGFILLKLQSVYTAIPAILLTALIFGFMHTIYPRPVFSMILGTAAGLLFATLYTFHPNIFTAAIAHSFLNFTAVYLGFFTFLDSRGSPKKTELHLG